ncbi:hypothetical protein O5D80_008410 [Batrachochytrium dendrobatidis]|nr:hypothetical protein O5D80_008410 [Batrachochytrium dendrobatidis]
MNLDQLDGFSNPSTDAILEPELSVIPSSDSTMHLESNIASLPRGHPVTMNGLNTSRPPSAAQISVIGKVPPRTSQSHPINLSWVFEYELLRQMPSGPSSIHDKYAATSAAVHFPPTRYIGGPDQERMQILPYVARFRQWSKQLRPLPYIPKRPAMGMQHTVPLFFDSFLENDQLSQIGFNSTVDAKPSTGLDTIGMLENKTTMDPSQSIACEDMEQSLEAVQLSGFSQNPCTTYSCRYLDSGRRTAVYSANQNLDQSLNHSRNSYKNGMNNHSHSNSNTLQVAYQNENIKFQEKPVSTWPLIHGNICLSSCPGKKVRLTTGPVDGRAVVNRDIKSDFQRIASMGVRAVVCCLYDEELALLGSPFNEYLETVHSLNITFIRIPIIEGGTPVCLMDTILVLDEIDACIKNGSNVLCHCRGGIGRAGVIVCCYLLYKGYCENAEDAIAYIRKRRSHKAIETEEQEHYIEQFYQMLYSFRNAYRKDFRA